MSRHRLTVVLSQAQGKHPTRRAMEESLLAALLMESGLDASVIPHLYDIDGDHSARLFLDSVSGDMVLLSWLFPRAAFWVLDRDGIKGHWGETQLKPAEEDDDEEEAGAEPPKGIGAVNVPDRHIYCLDMRDATSHQPIVEEIRRIAAECKARHESKQQAAPRPVELGLGMLHGNGNGNGNGNGAKASNGHVNGTAVPADFAPANGHAHGQELATGPAFAADKVMETPNRRWYPVIDYSRCTNCLECLDFCLFGVYGIDKLDRIDVENQDNCKRGCPACSRVCPEQAIMFPDYKTPAIAGAPVGAIGALKIDLSRLFGGDSKDALSQAVEERDRELVADGRDAVGSAVGLPKRQTGKSEQPKDDLDSLMDELDDLDL